MSDPATTISPWPTCLRTLVLLGALLAPGAASACMPRDPAQPVVDRPIVTYQDGSFVDAAADDGFNYLRAGPARDVGGGRVGQVIETDYGCELGQQLLFVDCTTGSAIAVWGVPGTDANGNAVTRSTRALQPPQGPLSLTGDTTLADVAALARRQGWSVRTDVPDYAVERGPQNRFDPFMGCKIFYPGSVGAGR